MQGRPTGTITFVLTDIVESTRLWQESPASMGRAVAEHEQVVRRVLERWDAFEFGTAGDSFAVAFSSATDAVQCAIDVQRELRTNPWSDVAIALRIGVHTGQADERDGRYFGPSVNFAARTCDLAGPDQIVVSESSRVLVGDRLDDAHRFVDLGPHQLKSFEAPEVLFAIEGPGLSHARPARSVAVAGNLPIPATSFVGRADDVESIAGLVSTGTAVTVVGLGGLGKTRISIEVGQRIRDRFDDGVWWIDLAPLSDGSTIAQLVATTLGATQQPGLPPDATIIDWLTRRSTLLIFDNCEHVNAEASALIASLLSACPGLAVLASSRMSLAIAAEKAWPLDAMDGASDASALLIERARLLDPTLDPSRWDRDDLTKLCDRLDGLPLAIEMAAARLRALSPGEILGRLDDRFRLLRNRDRHAAGRHQTLLGTLDWSYGLLAHDEQLLLDRLSVFPSDFDLSAVERICADDSLDEFDVIDLLASLVDNSLVALAARGDGTRYRLMETVRQYGDSHLADGDKESLRARLVEHVRTVATEAAVHAMSEDPEAIAAALSTFAADWDNIREAVRWATAFKEADAIEDILRSVWDFCFQTFRTEVAEWCRPAIDLPNPPMSAFTMLATATVATGDGIRLIDQALATIDDDTPDAGAALAYGVRHWFLVFKGGEVAIENAERGLHHAPALGQPEVAWQHANLASFLVDLDPDRAADHAAKALHYVTTSTNPLRTTCVPSLAVYEAEHGRAELAHELCDRSVEISQAAGQLWTSNTVRAQRAAIAVRHGVGDPRQDLIDALETARNQRVWYAVWLALGEAIPWLRTTCGDDIADLAVGYMTAKGIWFRGSTGERDARSGSTDMVIMRRDEVVDSVLVALEST